MHFKVSILLLEAYISKKNKKFFLKSYNNEVHCKKSFIELPNFLKINTNKVLF